MRKVLLAIVAISFFVTPATPSSAAWSTSYASWYGPGFYGQRTACGKTLTTTSMWVAALRSDLARCGMRVTVCKNSRCYHVRVMDRGAFRSDGRVWDLAPGLCKKLLVGRCYTTTVRWRKGW